VFDEPGSADLTANVDFAYLREAITGSGQSPSSHPDFGEPDPIRYPSNRTNPTIPIPPCTRFTTQVRKAVEISRSESTRGYEKGRHEAD
jgi:hypothetical protein